MDDVDIDALIDEEEEMMAELEQEAVQESRKRTMEEPPEEVPRKQRRSIAPESLEEAATVLLEEDKENEVLPGAFSMPSRPPAWPELDDVALVIDEGVEEEQAVDEEPSVVMTQRPDFSTDFLTVHGEAGRRFYLRVRPEEEEEEPVAFDRPLGRLNDELFDRLLEQARLERRRWDREREEETPAVVGGEKTELWVDKYAPRNYTDLLSEEFVNRSLLTWLKAWDGAVFGKTSRRAHKPSTLPAAVQDVRPELDAAGRPVQKVALLCGPPGLGKTTLAYIAAKHCGYAVVEVNASDDRSPELFRQRLESGASTRYSLDGDQRPVCVVLDEVDGAPQPAIDVLVAACRAGPGGKAPSGKKRDVPALLRPVICVCNDLYAPALRQLRPLAFVVKFPTPHLAKLSSRLLEVAQLERMKADVSALAALAERSERDIRSCLNTLQFLRGRGVNELSLAVLASLRLGHKDVQKGIFAAWEAVFALPRSSGNQASRAAAFEAGVSHAASLVAQRAGAVLRACGRAAGDAQRVVDGLHENFLAMRFKDARMRKVDGACDWLRFVDVVGKTVHKWQDFSLMRYQAFLPVYFHLHFACTHPERLQWPQASFAAHQAATRTEGLVTSLATGMSASTRLPRRCLVVEVLPLLVDILQPALRPVNTQLYSSRERQELSTLVANMLQFGLELRQERNQEGQFDFVLEPDLALVARFPAVRQTKGLSYSAKQLVARELAVERMRRAELARGPPPAADKKSSPAVRRQPAWGISEQVQLVRSVREEKSRDFFGRVVVARVSEPTAGTDAGKEDEKSPLNEKIWFRFKAGYSNAIRRPVRIKDLL